MCSVSVRCGTHTLSANELIYFTSDVPVLWSLCFPLSGHSGTLSLWLNESLIATRSGGRGRGNCLTPLHWPTKCCASQRCLVQMLFANIARLTKKGLQRKQLADAKWEAARIEKRRRRSNSAEWSLFGKMIAQFNCIIQWLYFWCARWSHSEICESSLLYCSSTIS